tara:strand:+ start:489 stop:701 length:213 start_codon:yes stop_codon:yes gene_type:complete
MDKYGISYVKKDNHKDSYDGFSLYIRFYKAWNKEHALNKFEKSKFYKEYPELGGSMDGFSNVRSVWKVEK